MVLGMESNTNNGATKMSTITNVTDSHTSWDLNYEVVEFPSRKFASAHFAEVARQSGEYDDGDTLILSAGGDSWTVEI